MQIYYISYPMIEKEFSENVLAIGFFDGVHLGHQKVIESAKEIANEKKVLSAVMTFDHHPLEVLGIKKIDQITPLQTKLKILEKMQIDICFVVEFSKEFANIKPYQFVEEFLINLNVKGIVVGYDFTFGKDGAGKPELLRDLSSGQYTVDIIEQYSANLEKVSSTRIRDNLLLGNVTEANQLLGRNYTIMGKVIHGEKRGRLLGYPTANIEFTEDFLSIKPGVYIVKVLYNNNTYLGVMNIGSKPTFHLEHTTTIEVHLLNFSQDIYGEILEVELLDYIRTEKKFNNIEELKRELNNDTEKARSFFSKQKVN